MLELFHRKRKAIFWAAAGAAGAAALSYSWYRWYESEKAISEAHSQTNILELAKETNPRIDEVDDSQVFSTSPSALTSKDSRARLHEDGDEQDLDHSMDRHFSYIQEVSAPQELDQLLPKLHAMLTQLTDIKLLKQQQQGSEPLSAAEQLRSLARLCFVRAVGSCWLIPCMDLLVRVKLNLIGRHLFLQEKLGKLRFANAQAVASSSGSSLPPRLSATAIETFLDCSWFACTGCRWVLDRVSEGVDVVLDDVSLDAEVTPNDLFQIMANMLREVEAAMMRCPWHRRTPTSQAEHDETLQREEEELEAAWASCEPGSRPEAESAAALSQQGGVVPAAGLRRSGNPWEDMLAGPSGSANINTQQAWEQGGPSAYQQAACTAATVEELHSELCTLLGSCRFTEAMRTAVQHTFRAAAAQIYSGFPSAPEASLPSEPAPAPPASPPGNGNGVASSRTLASAAATPRTSFCGGSLKPARDSRVFGTVPSSSNFLTGNGNVAVVKAARPLARVLRIVQASGDVAFENIKGVTKGISSLPSVMALSATAFACSAQLQV